MSDPAVPDGTVGALDERPDLSGGDPAVVFGRLFDAYAPGLHRYLARRVGDAAADDLVAETFLTALLKRADYQPARATARAWLYGIATNLLRHHHRGEQRALTAITQMGVVSRPETDGPEQRVLDQVDAHARVRGLAAALMRLAPGDRDVLLLTAWGELDSVEVAQALGIPVGTVRSRLHRVRRWLRAQAPIETGRQQ